MTRVIGVSGSLRSGSYNTALLHAATRLMPEDAVLEAATIRDIPLYDGDVEAKTGIPAPVAALKDQIAAADGLLLITPEYNNSIPGVFKNAIDWLSRPPADIGRVFGGRPVAVIGASPGGFGTILAQNAWLPVLRTLGTEPWFGGRLLVSRAQGVFNSAGALTDAAVEGQLRQFPGGLRRLHPGSTRLIWTQGAAVVLLTFAGTADPYGTQTWGRGHQPGSVLGGQYDAARNRSGFMAGSALFGLAGSPRNTAPLDADGRQDAAGPRPGRQPLVARPPVPDRPRADHVARPGRRPARSRSTSTSSTTPCGSRRATAAGGSSAGPPAGGRLLPGRDRAHSTPSGSKSASGPTPVEIADPVPFAKDPRHAAYDRQAAHTFWRLLVQADRLLKAFRGRLRRQVQPGPLLLGQLRPGGDPVLGPAAPPHPGGAERGRPVPARRTRTRCQRRLLAGRWRDVGTGLLLLRLPRFGGLPFSPRPAGSRLFQPGPWRVHPALRRCADRRGAGDGAAGLPAKHLRRRGRYRKMGPHHA